MRLIRNADWLSKPHHERINVGILETIVGMLGESLILNMLNMNDAIVVILVGRKKLNYYFI